MVKSYHLDYDTNGYPRAHFTEPPNNRSLIGLFLQMDVGQSCANCDDWIAATHAVVSGAQPSFEGTGNLFTISIKPEQVRIENAYADEDEAEWIEVEPQEFLQILNDWKNLLCQSA